MKYVICSVYDKATEAYMRPFFAQSEGQALRLFIDEANGDTPINQHPEDYAMFILGSFYDHNGEILPVEPKCLARAHEIIKRDK